MHFATRMLSDSNIAWIEVDSTALGSDGKPIDVDDVVVGYRSGGSLNIQCKKNEGDFTFWTFKDLESDLKKAGRTLVNAPTVCVAFYSRSPFGELKKIQEHAALSPDQNAYAATLPDSFKKLDQQLRTLWALPTESIQGVHQLLSRIQFVQTAEVDDMKRQQLGELELRLTQSKAAYAALWTSLDQLGARIGGSSATEVKHRLTREDTLSAISDVGSTFAAPRSETDLLSHFADVSAIGRSWVRTVAGHRFRRKATQELLDAIAAKSRRVVLTDGPGSGKTCVLLDLLDSLGTRPEVAALFVQAREYADCRTDAQREANGLPADLVGQVSRMADLKQVVVVIDSLDVVSLVRDHASLQYFLRVVDQLALRPNVTVICACRSFDLKYDARLSAKEWSKMVSIGPLSWAEEVKPLVESWGIDADALDESTCALLLLPRNLALFAEVVRRGGGVSYSTQHDLNLAYLELVVRRDPDLGAHVVVALEGLAHCMLSERRLEVPRVRLTVEDDVVTRLMSAGVLLGASAGKLTFGHQTLLDGLAVADAERRGASLLTFIRSFPAVPFIRPAVRAFFAYLRSSDAKGFRTQVRAVFESDVAYHLKRLIAESFGDIVPTPDDWPLLLFVYRNHRALFLSVYHSTDSDEWTTFWNAHLIPLVASERDSALLEEHVRRTGTRSNSFPQEAIQFWSMALTVDWADREWMQRNVARHLSSFERWDVSGARALLERLVEDRKGEQHSGVGPAVSRFVDSTDTGDDLLWRYMIGGLGAEDVLAHEFRRKLRSEPHEFHQSNFLSRRVLRSETLLGLALKGMEEWSKQRSAHFGATGGLLRTEFLLDTSYSLAHTKSERRFGGPLHQLLHAVEGAVLEHARMNSEWWRNTRSCLVRSDEAAFRYIAIRACIECPESNQELIGEVLQDECILRSSLRFEAGILIREAYHLLPESTQDNVSAVILGLFKDQEKYHFEAVRRDRAMLLKSIPAFLRNTETQAELARIEKALGVIELAPHIESYSGMVAPPFGFEQFIGMSDAGVARLCAHYTPGSDSGEWGSLIGGGDHVASQLGEAASRDPGRFLTILQDHRASIPQIFREVIVAGASRFLEHVHGSLSLSRADWKPRDGIDSALVTSQLLAEVGRASGEWRGSRESADAIEACSHVTRSDAEAAAIIAIARDLAAIADPTLRDDEDDLATAAINSIRGNAAEAVMILATRWRELGRSLPAGLDDCLLTFSRDPHPAVRGTILKRLPWFMQYERPLGWTLFENATENADERLWELAEPTLYYTYAKEFARVRECLHRLEVHGLGKARETWGRISMLCCLSGHVAWSDLHQILTRMSDIDAWHGVATVATHNATAEHRHACFAALRAAFMEAPARLVVANELDRLFQTKELVVVPRDLIAAGFSAIEEQERADQFRMHGFEEWLVRMSLFEPSETLTVAQDFAQFIGRKAIQVHDQRPIERVLTNLFREAEDREEADGGVMLRSVIALQDKFMATGVSLQEWLKDAERP